MYSAYAEDCEALELHLLYSKFVGTGKKRQIVLTVQQTSNLKLQHLDFMINMAMSPTNDIKKEV